MSSSQLPPDDSDQQEPGSFSDFIQGIEPIKANTIERRKPVVDPRISQILKDKCMEENKDEELALLRRKLFAPHSEKSRERTIGDFSLILQKRALKLTQVH